MYGDRLWIFMSADANTEAMNNTDLSGKPLPVIECIDPNHCEITLERL
jgi:hypothetical protein